MAKEINQQITGMKPGEGNHSCYNISILSKMPSFQQKIWGIQKWESMIHTPGNRQVTETTYENEQMLNLTDKTSSGHYKYVQRTKRNHNKKVNQL